MVVPRPCKALIQTSPWFHQWRNLSCRCYHWLRYQYLSQHLAMPYPLLPLDQRDPHLDFLGILALFSNGSYLLSFTTPNPLTWTQRHTVDSTGTTGMLLMPVGTFFSNLLPDLPTGGRKKSLSASTIGTWEYSPAGSNQQHIGSAATGVTKKTIVRKIQRLYSNESSGTLRSQPWKELR